MTDENQKTFDPEELKTEPAAPAEAPVTPAPEAPTPETPAPAPEATPDITINPPAAPAEGELAGGSIVAPNQSTPIPEAPAPEAPEPPTPEAPAEPAPEAPATTVTPETPAEAPTSATLDPQPTENSEAGFFKKNKTMIIAGVVALIVITVVVGILLSMKNSDKLEGMLKIIEKNQQSQVEQPQLEESDTATTAFYSYPIVTPLVSARD